MKIKLNENLPAGLVPVLTEFGHEVDTVVTEGLAGRNDPAVWDTAQKEERFLVTQDLDFSDIRVFTPGTHAGILLVRLREPGRTALVRYLSELFADEPVDTWAGCFVVATDHKLRVRRPK